MCHNLSLSGGRGKEKKKEHTSYSQKLLQHYSNLNMKEDNIFDEYNICDNAVYCQEI